MLSLKNIKKSFTRDDMPLFENFNLTLKQGEFCVVLGSNGSGKSTLLKMIAGSLEPDQGEIFMNGVPYETTKRATRIAQVNQDLNQSTIGQMTVLENMALSLMNQEKRRFTFYSRFKTKIYHQLKALQLGLEEKLDLLMSSLSGGQRQTIALLMAMQQDPELLLLDEHTSALDRNTAECVMKVAEQFIHQAQLTTIMVTHKLDDALRYGNRLLILDQGKICVDISGPEKNQLTFNNLLTLLYPKH